MAHHHEPKAPSAARGAALCERISDRVTALLEPMTTVETQWIVVDPLGYRASLGYGPEDHMVPVRHVVEHPSLLLQLSSDIGGSTAGVSSSTSSRPPGSLAAADTLALIRKQSRWWVRRAFNAESTQVPADLQLIAARAHELDIVDLKFLDRDVRRWWAEARIVTTWETAPLKPHVPCMVCGTVGRIQVVLDPMAALCRQCGSAWDASTIGILGEHIRLATSASIDVPRQPRPAVDLVVAGSLPDLRPWREQLPTEERTPDLPSWRARQDSKRTGGL